MTSLLRRVFRMKSTFMHLNKFRKEAKHVTKKHGYLRSLCTTAKSQSVYLVDEDNNSVDECIKSNSNRYTDRTYNCGDLKCENVGEHVTLCGWLEYQRMNKFVVLRDSYGETQLLIKDEDIATQNLLNNLPYESIIKIKGTVLSRPKEMVNKKQATGEIEVLVDNFEVLNKAKDTLPFNLREFQKAKESLRMQYRYLDLRFPQMQRNLRVRSKMLMKMREFLVNKCEFVDVETPTLFKATPGGAKEFVVPTRFPGLFYSLVQSPQQFKQMLMAGAVDRYFQIARCYRDEGSRSDRQPEFTQLDIEMSFTSVEDILSLIEDLLCHSWPSYLGTLANHFPRISFRTAMEVYGSDKPDVRFDFKLNDCTDILKKNLKLIKDEKNFGAYYIVFPKQYANLSKSVKEKMNELGKHHSQAKLVQNKVTSCSDWISKTGNLLGEDVASKLAQISRLENDSVMFLAFGNRNDVQSLLGKIRIEYVNNLESLGVQIRKKGMHFLWVLDFPLFEQDENGNLQSVHHPFTSPHPDDFTLLDSQPLQVRSLAYDLVLNGNEVGGGSIRIHNPHVQEKILEMLKIEKDSMHHILDMLGSGCPPHGGIALGLDRLLSVILNTGSIRDVIAFPKTMEGRDPVSGAPSPLTELDQKLYHIKCVAAQKN